MYTDSQEAPIVTLSRDTIKMNINEIVWENVDWINLAQESDRWRDLVSTVKKLRVP
jgi:hypothetical protein